MYICKVRNKKHLTAKPKISLSNEILKGADLRYIQEFRA